MDDERLNSYRQLVADYDEMLGPSGTPEAWWAKIADHFAGLDEAHQQELLSATHRAIREHGITYSVHGDPMRSPRSWLLDPVPFVISEEDWKGIEKGLIQRASLLAEILEDIYGPQRLFREKLLPPEMIYRHSGFIEPCMGFKPAGGRRLISYGTDLARGPDGRMWVINDRTQAPSGAGYTIENRVIMARLLPGLFKDCAVRRLAAPYRNYREFLRGLMPVEGREPRIVMLTPGPFNETYFEHAYLASYLGIDLVQGNDLTVRDARVWIKSLGGLEPVDVIVRRVDELWCDPLEFESESQLGVPGLLEAARRGNVAIANPLGTGLLENPALLAFLPGICRFLRGEDLLLPSAATWWCGQRKECDYVLANLEKMVIKTIVRAPNYGTVYCNQLSGNELESLRARIQAEPSLFAGQEMVSFSSAPALIDGTLQPRRTIMRSVVMANVAGGYDVVPGGLTLSTTQAEGIAVTYSRDGIAKDSWVCGSDVETHVSLLSEKQGGPGNLGERHLPSRAGENLFWVARYAERVEVIARVMRRLLRIYFQNEGMALLGEESKLSAEILASLEKLTWIPGKDEEDEPLSLEAYIHEVSMGDNPGSLRGNLSALMEAAYSVRDLWSPDSWRVIGSLEQISVELSNSELEIPSVAEKIDNLIIQLIAFSGLNLESMTRDTGWVLLEIGRKLERSHGLITLMESFMLDWKDPDLASFRMETFLAASDSLVTHRRRYRAEPTPESVLELLLVDKDNPRSLLYYLMQMEEQIERLPHSAQEGVRLTPEAKLIPRRIADLRLGDLEALIALNPKSRRRSALADWLIAMRQSLLELSEILTGKYFIHAPYLSVRK